MKRKPKANGVDLRQKLSADFVAALQADWNDHGKEIIAALRTRAPAKYAEIIAHFVTSDLLSEPTMQYNSSATWEDLGRGLLASVGCDENLMTDEMAQNAVKLHDEFIETLAALIASHGVLSEARN